MNLNSIKEETTLRKELQVPCEWWYTCLKFGLLNVTTNQKSHLLYMFARQVEFHVFLRLFSLLVIGRKAVKESHPSYVI